MKIQWTCPHCGHEVPDWMDEIGLEPEQQTCPFCGKNVLVPAEMAAGPVPQDLKPCPFCGEYPKYRVWESDPNRVAMIRCTNRDCRLTVVIYSGMTVEEAKQIWNHRPTEDLLLGNLEAARKEILRLKVRLDTVVRRMQVAKEQE